MNSMLKRPSAWIPIALTGAILAVIGMYLAHIIPPDPTGDEGVGAHLFQLWIVLECASILFFAATWLPHASHEAAKVLALQIALALVPLALVFSQGW